MKIDNDALNSRAKMKVSTMLVQLVLGLTCAKIKEVTSEEACGHPYGMMAGKIVGGYDVGYYKYPWFVAMTSSNFPICGATLISKKTVVTAAHCYDQRSDDPLELANLYMLKLGAYNICSTSEATQKSFKVRKVYIHERYKKEDPFFDIALLVLKDPVEGFEPVCIPTKALDTKTRPWEGQIAGFGRLSYRGQRTCIQREARVRIYPDNVCKDMISRADNKMLSRIQHVFCAGYLEGGVDACQGDSGGPLMVLQTESKIALLGITSFGYNCALKDRLGIYTDVSHFLDWIEEKSNLLLPEEETTEDNDTDEEGFTSTPSAGEDSIGDNSMFGDNNITENDDDDYDDDDNDDDDDEDDDEDDKRKTHKKVFLSKGTKIGNANKNHRKQKHLSIM